jgi:Tfp pilus assembly protein PilF
MSPRILVPTVVLVVATLVCAQDKSKTKGKDSKLTPKEQMASKLVTKASQAMQKQDWDGGIRLCDAALRLEPDNVSALWMRGLAHWKKSDPVKAIADYTSALKQDARMAPAYRDRGIAYMDKKQTDRALADFNRYIQLRPTDPEGYHERALAYQAKGEKSRAEADLRKARELREKAKKE